VEFARINPVRPLYGNILSSYLAPRTKHQIVSQHLSVPQGKANSPRGVNPVGSQERHEKWRGSCWTSWLGLAGISKLSQALNSADS